MGTLNPAAADLVRRMLREAEDRLADVEILESAAIRLSDSSEIIKVLALDVLLKAATLSSGLPHAHGHDYGKLWSQLPAAAREFVIAAARDRVAGGVDSSGDTTTAHIVDYSRIESVLQDLRTVFTRARYGYELYASSEEGR